ncbi:hypothetical protein BMETH_509_0 [methanotrophic bacterial endosymbiont of Bathymodiolus sp.]|nr:hypothetical protein BMETH_509_0 [methanotrophic bacterial endosymbiont of Bathymodiolus sp.]
MSAKSFKSHAFFNPNLRCQPWRANARTGSGGVVAEKKPLTIIYQW